jgi:hypothetical protein
VKLSAAALLLAVVAASPEIRYFHYTRSLAGLPSQGGQSCLVLNPGIFTHAAPGLADLRLYRDTADQPNPEQPYVIRTAAPEEGAQKSISLLNLGARDGRTAFDAEMPDGKYSDLQLAVTGHDFIATIAVSGSRTQGGSETKLGSYTIFDLTRQKLGRSTVLHLPESDFPYLHFDVTGPLHPESFTGLSVDRLPTSDPQFVGVAETSLAMQKRRNSVFEFTVPANVPVDRIVFVPAAEPASFSRNVTISAAQILPKTEPDSTPATAPPPAVTYGNLLRVHSLQDGHRINEEHLAIDAPRTDFSTPAKWTITIENGDDAPLKFESVRLQMLQRKLCFEAAPSAHYDLYYGDPALSSPRYDYATLFAPQPNATQINANPDQPNPAWQPRPDDRPFTEKHPWLLWAALIGVIALLGLVALRTAKRSPQTPQ